MKIIDIISEDINEGWISRLARKVTGTGASTLGVSERKALIDTFARRYPPDHTMTPADLAAISRNFHGEDANKVAKEILKRSTSIKDWRAVHQNVRRMSQRWQTIKNVIKGLKVLWGPLITVELAAILWEPFSHYSDRMDLADQWLNANDEKERWTQEQYDQFHHSEMMSLIEKVAKLVIFNKLLKLPGHALRIFGKKFSDAFNSLTTPVRLWVAGELSSSEEAAWFLPILLVEEALGRQFVTDTIGEHFITQAEGYVFNRIEQAKKEAEKKEKEKQQGTTQSTTTSATQSDAASSAQSATRSSNQKLQVKPSNIQQTTLNLLKPYVPSDWEYYSPTLVRHIPTQTLHPKAVVDQFKE